KLTSSIYCKYNQVSNFNKWINYSFEELDILIKNQENRPKKYHSDNLDKLLKYYKKEIFDSKYQQLVKLYSVLGGLLEAVEEYGIEDWMANSTYITVFVISAVLSEIPPLVITVLLSDQKETLPKIIEENNLVVKHLNCVDAKLVRLYFDGAPHNQNWLDKMYFTNYKFQNKLGLIK
ncbi:17618_t:CDS:2, partial [Racocetra fulgida]